MTDINNTIKQLYMLDNEIKNHNNYINKLKKNKIKLENNLIDIIKKNNIQDKEFHYNNIKYQYIITNSYSLSKKSINTCLYKYFNNINKANELTNYIYNNRSLNKKEIIKKKKI